MVLGPVFLDAFRDAAYSVSRGFSKSTCMRRDAIFVREQILQPISVHTLPANAFCDPRKQHSAMVS